MQIKFQNEIAKKIFKKPLCESEFASFISSIFFIFYLTHDFARWISFNWGMYLFTLFSWNQC